MARDARIIMVPTVRNGDDVPSIGIIRPVARPKTLAPIVWAEDNAPNEEPARYGFFMIWFDSSVYVNGYVALIVKPHPSNATVAINRFPGNIANSITVRAEKRYEMASDEVVLAYRVHRPVDNAPRKADTINAETTRSLCDTDSCRWYCPRKMFAKFRITA